MPLIPTLKDLIFLIWSADGWIAGHLEILLQGECRVAHCTSVRMENREEVEEVLDRIRPTNMPGGTCPGTRNEVKGATPRDTKKLQRHTNPVPSLTLIGCDFYLFQSSTFCLFRSSTFAFSDLVLLPFKI